jgi:ACR3 family arsenite transporter
MIAALAAAIAARGRWILVAGLVAGLVAPDLSRAMRPLVGPLVVILLFLAVLRIGPEGLKAGRAGLSQAIMRAAVLQAALPLGASIALAAAGRLEGPLALGVVLILAAAPITGAAHLTVMAGGAPAPALRQTVVGTALLPFTVLPVFALIPAFGSAQEVAQAVVRLVAIILCAGGLALVLRARRIVPGTASALGTIDAVAAVLLGAVVVGMMSAAGETLRADPAEFARVMAVVVALCFGLQAATRFAGARLPPAEAPALAVVAGNRNVALFLGVLPAPVAADLLLLIGCYQVPMYLTPVVLPRILALMARR